jgi:hypothetical protein
MTEWTPIDNAIARKEITKRKRHFNVSKSSFISSVHSDAATVNPRDVLIDESKQADIENLADCLRVLGDGQTPGTSLSRSFSIQTTRKLWIWSSRM